MHSKLYSLAQDGKAADPGCGSLHHQLRPCEAVCCTPGPLSCRGSLRLETRAAAGRAGRPAGGGPVSGQGGAGGRTEAVAADDDDDDGGDGAEGKILQLCACSGYSVK